MHLEAITSKAKKLLGKLQSFPEYYLAGGTALALQIGHRISADFDFFRQGHSSENVLAQAENTFKDEGFKIIINQESQLTLSIEGIEVSFINYPFPVFSGLIDYKGIKVLPSLEVAAMKAYTLGRRATLKDYIDLYFVVKGKIGTLEEIIKLSEKKHADNFNSRLFLEQLIYLEDIKEESIEFLGESVSKDEICSFFEQRIKKLW